jgi:two-component system, NarL family, nitrate/nitrite sensor histidine kinase NarX
MADTAHSTETVKQVGPTAANQRLSAGWRLGARALASPLFAPLFGLGLILALCAVTAFLTTRVPAYADSLVPLQIPLAIGGILLTALVVRAIRRQLLEPLAELRSWALEVQGGNFAARISEPADGEFAELARDINDVGEALQICSSKMEAEVRRQTERLAQKTRYLEILYDVTASINACRSIDDLLERVLYTLRDVVDARAACVRLCTDHEQMRLVASVGLSKDVAAREQVLSLDRCVCGQAIKQGDIRFQPDIRRCSEVVGRDFFDSDNVQMVAVPLLYRDRTVGVYNLFVDNIERVACDDMTELFTTIGRHLGTAIEKSRLDEEANRLSIMEERTRLAYELHDSLAQTLASVRFQVRVLDQALHQGNESTLWQELERVENSLDAAHTELRQLIAHFRAPAGGRGLLPSIENLVSRFRKENRINIFLQNEWRNARLPHEHGLQVLRIIQESLNNICKHSKAQNARILLGNDGAGNFHVLIEDDGIGFQKPVMEGPAGEHIGLSIMQDRARQLGGELRMESEPGEGTRIMLSFRDPKHRDGLREVSL